MSRFHSRGLSLVVRTISKYQAIACQTGVLEVGVLSVGSARDFPPQARRNSRECASNKCSASNAVSLAERAMLRGCVQKSETHGIRAGRRAFASGNECRGSDDAQKSWSIPVCRPRHACVLRIASSLMRRMRSRSKKSRRASRRWSRLQKRRNRAGDTDAESIETDSD